MKLRESSPHFWQRTLTTPLIDAGLVLTGRVVLTNSPEGTPTSADWGSCYRLYTC